ncbi:MAG: hypothetical protein A2Y45_07575 [Tenericutes bacterium GWC2_34_14]|nr:MAG: hypothetical protein A2Z84_08700 [Tenericutes bacterium GWA2_35_7]OHE29761.1 MAG: hypothetical protein A2Y45_07575 [Tenericutes bacterium GWC2_34_14]OHE34740.1 MAG: hypothetical protein A2012_01185 [Tenericutes bacterium GWE2_34_108]OHE37399.1 MAG: hypothetical protein A2Y46_01825 [Tenericutes bacterium GWF1_35_14]OHE39467.1 MAG: hypothetical protein A2Y44_01035 [Tenericutes bacterium GWF2_35_184]OHE42551.1 MAG: hypothetical protein A3K26_04135 [Tenericutes bacterium RIFOXYA12_FULL_35_
MLKWILRFFYIMIVSVATLYVYGSANYGRLEAYYEAYMADEIDNDDVYLTGINTLMNLAYYKQDPVYSYTSASDTHNLKLSVYAIGIQNEGVYLDGIMIFVNELDVIDGEGNPIENPIIKVTAHLSDKTYNLNDELVDTPSIVFDSTKEFPYSYAPTLFLVYAEDYLLIPETNTYAMIERISVSYSDGTRDESGQYEYDTTWLLDVANGDPGEAAYNKVTDFTLDETSFRLTEIYGEELTAEEITTLGLVTDRGDLKEFNGVIVKTMVIYTLIVMALTYVLFFHKYIMEKVREKKFEKEHAVPETNKVQDAIFQDVEYPTEDKDKKKK